MKFWGIVNYLVHLRTYLLFMIREIIVIDRAKCNGCGLCVPNCHEGALQIIDGKAVLVSELACDGLGACIGFCPEGALNIEIKEAEPYQEEKVMENMVPKGINTVFAHLKHLIDHKEMTFFKQGMAFLESNHKSMYLAIKNKLAAGNIIEEEELPQKIQVAGCPSHRQLKMEPSSHPASQSTNLYSFENKDNDSAEAVNTGLTNWPIQMHLINPASPHFTDSDLLLAADCTAFAAGNFHTRFASGKTIIIACPKLDSHKEIYVEKLKFLLTRAAIRSLTVLVMEVPCCSGLVRLVQMALAETRTGIPVRAVTVSIKGEVLNEKQILCEIN